MNEDIDVSDLIDYVHLLEDMLRLYRKAVPEEHQPPELMRSVDDIVGKCD
jgi:hypothetical protein